MKVMQSSLLARLDHPYGRPKSMLYTWGDDDMKALRCPIHEAAHATAAVAMLVPSFTGIRKGKDFFIAEMKLEEESRHMDLMVTWAGPCAEQIFCVENENDNGMRGDFEDSLARLRTDRIPPNEWRAELQRGIARAASIVESNWDCIFALALEFNETDRLSASQCKSIIARTIRERIPPTAAELRAEHAERKRQTNFRLAVARTRMPVTVASAYRGQAILPARF